MLNEVFKRLQRHNIFESKGKVESMLNKSSFETNLIQHASTRFQHLLPFPHVGRPVNDLFKSPQRFGLTKSSTHVEANVETA